MTKLVSLIQEALGEEYEITEVSVNKNGYKKLGIQMRKKGESIAPVAYPEGYTGTTEEIAEKIVNNFTSEYVENLKKELSENVSSLTKEKILQNIVPVMINRERNGKMLKNTPHEDFLDLSVIYRYQLNPEATFIVTNEVMEKYNIAKEELKNASEDTKYLARPLIEVMLRLQNHTGVQETELPESVEQELYVITTPELKYGASAITTDLPHRVAKAMHTSLLVIPSSIHELILIPNTGEVSVRDARDMVKEVNGTLNSEDLLSDSVYVCDMETGRTVLAV